MISLLRGVVAVVGKDHLVLQVGGVGFHVSVPRPLLEGLTGAGQELTLFTHLQVRENELTLYGCSTEEELDLFRLLQTVPGIGPKLALSVLSALPAARLREAIAQGDEATLARVPGIGPKTARKLAFDLRDKVAAEQPGAGPWPPLAQPNADLIAALVTLGYSVNEAQEAIRALPREPLPLEEQVRLALRHLGS